MDQPEGFISKNEEKKVCKLQKTFSMKDLGNASYILGIKIYRDRSRKLIGLSQSLYVDKVLGRFQMEHSKKGFLPVRHGIYQSKSMSPKALKAMIQMSRIPYASAIGSLMESVADGDISVLKVASADNIADPLTKPMSQL
ncbi:hypothetical protein L3X38_025334 [Prunus dulcis]|uniref:Transposable element protein n=1 Tax=Prunus dulcis TaxID=3755 RepID=A0AAD4W2A7_PRUDU|nr:hypothetical protein L3X38_025334 [Prunus dulcis]